MRASRLSISVFFGVFALCAAAMAPGLFAQAASVSPAGALAPKPLFRDPVFDGAADPSIVFDRGTKTWKMFYTNRRANVPGLTAVSWVHGTPIGIAESGDGANWTYRGTVEFPKNIPGTDVATPTYWAPHVMHHDGVYHMYLTIVPGVFEDWNHPRNIVHLTSRDLRAWAYESTLPLVTDKVIDACVARLPDGTWRLWYNNERAGKKTFYADSPDLYRWTDKGSANLPRDRGEAPLVFAWKGRTWMLIDLLGNAGLGAYRSDDALTWERQSASLLDKPGAGVDDNNGGHHPEVVISGDRAFLYYFVHPGVPDMKRSSLQVVELKVENGWLTADRDAPTYVALRAGDDARGFATTSNASATAAAIAPNAEGFINPLVPQRADPHVFRDTDGTYYLTATAPEYDRIELRRAATIRGLATAEVKTIWRKHASGPMSHHIWAPEIHKIDGKWYVYFTASPANAIWEIRPFVLENASADPLAGEWVEKGQIKLNWESFSLDATTFEHRGTRYLVWTQRELKNKGTNIYIAAMDNPWTIRGQAVLLSKPEFPWEQRGYWVNEGPAVLHKNGRLFMTFSASATDANYCLGLLTAPDTANPLDASAWVKSPEPVFVTSEANGQFGPGHNSFTTSEDGKDVIMVYHARNYRDIKGDPLKNHDRHTRVQKVAFAPDGSPVFGVPVPDNVPMTPDGRAPAATLP